MLLERRLHVSVRQHLSVDIGQEFRAGPLGQLEQLQTADMHGVLAGFGKQEHRVGR